MKKLALATIGFTFLLTSFNTKADVKRNFCENRLVEGGVQELLASSSNQLSFKNRGGIINGGVCWWHSRFTRNALYLAQYYPNLPRPTQEEGESIVAQIRKGKSIVHIPGYANLNEFSRDFGNEIQESLESWQRFDGMVRQQWIVGLAGKPVVAAEKSKIMMDELYDRVIEKKEVVYQKLQSEGIEAHAWLVLGMTHLAYKGGTRFVPFTGQTKELNRLRQVVDKSFVGII